MKTQSFQSPTLPWLQETRLLDHIDQDSVRCALEDWKDGGKKENWLIDCSYAQSVDQQSLLSGVHYLTSAKNAGLQRIALVLASHGPTAAFLIKSRTSIEVRAFDTRDQAIGWFYHGCQ